MADLLVESGCNINAQNLQQETPLLLAMKILLSDTLHGNKTRATNKRDHVVGRFLITAGADVNIQDLSGRTCLHYAAMAGSEVMVQNLINANSMLDTLDATNSTALALVMQKMYENKFGVDFDNILREESYTNVSVALIEAGTDINRRTDIHNNTLLMFAVANSMRQVVTSLIK